MVTIRPELIEIVSGHVANSHVPVMPAHSRTGVAQLSPGIIQTCDEKQFDGLASGSRSFGNRTGFAPERSALANVVDNRHSGVQGTLLKILTQCSYCFGRIHACQKTRAFCPTLVIFY